MFQYVMKRLIKKVPPMNDQASTVLYHCFMQHCVNKLKFLNKKIFLIACSCLIYILAIIDINIHFCYKNNFFVSSCIMIRFTFDLNTSIRCIDNMGLVLL